MVLLAPGAARAAPPDLAPGEERVVRESSRWVAMIPFGAGQYQNGDVPLGVFFTTSETVLGATSLITIALYNGYINTINRARSGSQVVPAHEANSMIGGVALVNRMSFGAWAGLTAIGVVQAQIAFVPEKATVRRRPREARPQVAPVATWVPGGGVLGLGGSF